LFIPYTDPGYILFKKVETEISLFTTKFGRAPQVIFLENHGVFVAANSVSEINSLYTIIIDKINQKIKESLPSDEQTQFSSPVIDKIQELNAGFTTFTAMGVVSSLIHHFVKDHLSFQKANIAFTPDDIVYCKAHYLFIPAIGNEQEQLESAKILINSYVDTYGYLPKVLVLEGCGVVAVEDSIKSVLNVLEVYSNILKISFLSENFGGPKFMTRSQIEFIDNWEVENYRRKMAKS
jgi:rhamnose utilization protein RhaD (predicted bifunctional aldolase and dehydrogenase)